MIHTSKMQILRTNTVNNSIELNVQKRKDGIKSGTKLQASHEKEIPSPIVEKTKNVLLVCETNPLCIL